MKILYVVKAGKEFKLLAKNQLNDACMTTPAITDGIMYFRTMKYLVAVGN
jgi:outer membrane protein assembly factor BamB